MQRSWRCENTTTRLQRVLVTQLHTSSLLLKLWSEYKVKNRIPAHRASLAEDFQVLRDIVLANKRNEAIANWIREKQKTTYIRISEDWRDCDFEYPGWVK